MSRELRETVLHSVCARFTTVLGPGSDWYHEDHIHLDLMERRNNYRICQWNVWDPLPQIAPLLPAERPDEAPPREVAAKTEGRSRRSGGDQAEVSERRVANSDKPARRTDAAESLTSPTSASLAKIGKPRNKKAPVKPALLIRPRIRRSATASSAARRRPAAPSAN